MQSRFSKKRGILVAFAVVALIAVLLFVLTFRKKERYRVDERFRVDNLLDYSTEYFGHLSDYRDEYPGVEDALRLCLPVLQTLLWSDSSEWTVELLAPIDMLMDQFYEYGYLPREPYGPIGDYVTAMDAPLLAVTAELAYERGLGEMYRQYMEDLIPYIVSGTEEGGFVLKYGKTKWWPLEDAWATVTEEDAYFILNGSLFGMVYIEMLKNLTGDPLLVELSEKTLNAYREKADGFIYPDGTWCYYSLNSSDGTRTINQIKKSGIEIDALRSLYLLTEEPFYNEQLEIRIQLMANLLPVYIVRDGGTNTAMFLRACAPHPYLANPFSFNLVEFLDAGGNVVASADVETVEVSDAYTMMEVPDGVTSYRLYRYGGIYQGEPVNKRLWAEAPVKYIEKSELVTAPAPGDWGCSHDSVSLEGGKLLLNPGASESPYGRATYYLNEGQPYTTESYWLVEINNPTEESLPMRAILYDVNGTALTRTLLSCEPGKNILLYSPLGFKDHDWPLDGASELSLVIVTDGLDGPVELELGDFYYFHKTADVVNYLSQYKYLDFWIISE